MSDSDKTLKEKYKEIILHVLEDEGKGSTIRELEKEYKSIAVDEEQKDIGKQKKWHRMKILNEIITGKLDLILTESIRKETACIISDLREEGKIIDARYKFPRYGVWRLTSKEEEKTKQKEEEQTQLTTIDSNLTKYRTGPGRVRDCTDWRTNLSADRNAGVRRVYRCPRNGKP